MASAISTLKRTPSMVKSFVNTVSGIFKSDENKYQSLLESSKAGYKLNKKVLPLLITTLLITGILIKVLIFNQPRTAYDRKHDSELLQFVHVSKAALEQPKNGSLFCWVQTSSKYHEDRAIAINQTWLKRCDHGQLFTNNIFQDESVPYSTVFAGIPDSYENLFHKSRYAFHYIWKHVSKNFDWYLKADDDTYVIVENLRHFLAELDPNEPYYIGYTLKPFLDDGYNAGGAGYIFSNKALELFDEQAYLNETLCPHDEYEDVGIGRCLANIGIFPMDTRNENGQNRFNTYNPDDVYTGRFINDEYTIYNETTGMSAFAPDVISFHHLTPEDIRTFEMLLYIVKVHRLPIQKGSANKKVTRKEL